MTCSEIKALQEWFLKQKRSFPWRESVTPYAVWVSEVMLQQTRASVVVEYFHRWMKKFPSLEDLAKAPLEEIFKVWEGLGYYSRARNLKEGALQILKEGKGFPSTHEELLKIKGIGPYTAGAILSFAFHQKAAAVDGNVIRVISRYQGIRGDISSSKVKKTLEHSTLSLLPEEEPWVVMEAFIELGATVCLPRNPDCSNCPLKKSCRANLCDLVEEIPAKKKRKETIYLHRQVVLLLCGEEVLVQIGEEGKVLGGLAEFPSFSYSAFSDLEEQIEQRYQITAYLQEELPLQKQSFTRYQVELYPVVFEVKEKKEVEGYFWHSLDTLERKLTFSSGHKRILQSLLHLKEKSLL
jgi:A/G-specific adenine glycosylase